MKYLITALLFLSIISCQDQEFENLEVLTQNINPEDSHRIPECLELEIESTEDIVIKIGVSNGNSEENSGLYWVIYENNYFGNQLNSDCEISGCVGWCGLTTQAEIEYIFEKDWTLIWER